MGKHTCWTDLAKNIETLNGVVDLTFTDLERPIRISTGESLDMALPVNYTYRKAGEKKTRRGYVLPPFCPLCGKQRDDGTPVLKRAAGAKKGGAS
jgi:hypothetical protein